MHRVKIPVIGHLIVIPEVLVLQGLRDARRIRFHRQHTAAEDQDIGVFHILRPGADGFGILGGQVPCLHVIVKAFQQRLFPLQRGGLIQIVAVNQIRPQAGRPKIDCHRAGST